MSEGESLLPIEVPVLPRASNADLIRGLGQLPEERVATLTPDQYEILALNWADFTLRSKYKDVSRWGSSGDKGRDVVGLFADDSGWDNYQCKRMVASVSPSVFILEVAKVVYWTSVSEYTAPLSSAILAPKGAGTTVRQLCQETDRIRPYLLEKWDEQCASRITTGSIPMDVELRAYVDEFDFSIFSVIDGDRIVREMRHAPLFPYFFGGGLAGLPEPEQPPEQIGDHELGYIKKLVDAYHDDCDDDIASPEDAMKHQGYGPHLVRSRRSFYCAESLEKFARDRLPAGTTFRDMQDEVLEGVVDVAAGRYASGYERVRGVTQEAIRMQLSKHPIEPMMGPAYRKGVCHQLANEDKLTWMQP